jgi:hypothetical protein
MVALIVAAEGLVAPRVRTLDSGSRVEMSWNASVKSTNGPEVRAEVLCFGDSLIKLGILPRVLEDRHGLSAYNFAVLGGQAPSSYFLLRRVLDQNLRPRAVLVDFSEELLSLAPGQNPSCWADTFGLRQSTELAWHSCDPALAVSTGLHRLLTRWCDQNHRSAFLGIGLETRAADDPRMFERNWRLNRGAQVAPRAFVPVEGLCSANGERWRPQPANTYYVDRLLRTAEDSQIPVFWILTPSIPVHREQLEQSGLYSAYRNFVADRVAAFDCLTVLDGQRLFADTGAFRDPIHVNRDGAIRLSVAVGAAIEPRLRGGSSGARWIDLVEMGDQATSRYQEFVEDLDQSRAAIEPRELGQSSRRVALW